MKKKLKEWVIILCTVLFFVFLNGCIHDDGPLIPNNTTPPSPISLFSGSGPYSASCPLVFSGAPSKTLLKVYYPSAKFVGVACSIPLGSAYCSSELGSTLDDGTYSVRASIDNVDYSTNFEFKKSAECPNCYINGKAYKDKDTNSLDGSLYCDAKNNPHGWSTTACVHYAPGITVIPSYQTGSPSQSMSFTVYINNNDLSTCANSTFTIIPGAPEGWATSGNQTVEIPPQVTASTEITFTPPSSASGEIQLTVKAEANGLWSTSYATAEIVP